nr:hypothetical protein [Pseudoalteromonas sp. TAE56]
MAFIGLAVLPYYISLMGVEAYGLVGFFAMLQAWFNLLDLGLTATISREAAKNGSGSVSNLAFRQLYRALGVVFFLFGCTGAIILLLLTDNIALNWLTVEKIEIKDVIFSLNVMVFCLLFRWLIGLFRGVLTGYEKFVWLSFYNLSFTSLRFLGVFIPMSYFGYSVKVFFIYQAVLASLECMVIFFYVRKTLPKVEIKQIGWSLKPIKPVLYLSLSLSASSMIWVVAMQVDKLILSKTLNLSDYGYFTLGVLAANSVMLLTTPINSVLMPRFANLFSLNKYEELKIIYNKFTQLVVCIAGSLSFSLYFFSKEIMFIWTGDVNVSENSHEIMGLYALGNLFLAINLFPYFLQYAKGDLRLYLIGNIIMLLILIPSMYLISQRFGGKGAGYIWLFAHLLYFIFWVPVLHNKLKIIDHSKWLFSNVVKVLVPSFFLLMFCSQLYEFATVDRIFSFIMITLFSTISLIISFLFSDEFNFKTKRFIKSKGINK